MASVRAGAVEVPSDQLFAFLKSKGFELRPGTTREIVYAKKHERDPRYVVLVYTSVHRGSARARAKGKDAIRVCAIFDDSARVVGMTPIGVIKLPRVHRTGSVEATLDRMLSRMRAAYAACNERIKRHAC